MNGRLIKCPISKSASSRPDSIFPLSFDLLAARGDSPVSSHSHWYAPSSWPNQLPEFSGICMSNTERSSPIAVLSSSCLPSSHFLPLLIHFVSAAFKIPVRTVRKVSTKDGSKSVNHRHGYWHIVTGGCKVTCCGRTSRDPNYAVLLDTFWAYIHLFCTLCTHALPHTHTHTHAGRPLGLILIWTLTKQSSDTHKLNRGRWRPGAPVVTKSVNPARVRLHSGYACAGCVRWNNVKSAGLKP